MTIETTRRRLIAWLGLTPAAGFASATRASRPAREPVRVLFTRVNGEPYYRAADAFADLAIGQPVELRREPANPHDRRAIEVLDMAGRKLGYVARSDNSAVARMMDAGERFSARVARLDRPLDIRLTVDWLPDGAVPVEL